MTIPKCAYPLSIIGCLVFLTSYSTLYAHTFTIGPTDPSVSLTSSGGNSRLCAGTTFTLKATTKESNLRYEWFRNDKFQVGANGNSLVITQAGEYAVRVIRIGSDGDSTARLTILPQLLVQEGLVAYYPFDGDAQDYSGNKNHGTIKGRALMDTSRFKVGNSAISLMGVDSQYVEVSASNSLQNVRNLSITGWFNYDTLPNSAFRLLSFGGQSQTDNEQGYELAYEHNASKLVFRFGSFSFASNRVNIKKNQWYHIAGTASNDSLKIYLNGLLIAQTAYIFTPLTFSQKLNIGRKSAPITDAFKGRLDDIRLYNRAISADELQLLAKPATYNFAPCEGDKLELTAPSVSGVSYAWKNDTTNIPVSLNNPFVKNGAIIANNRAYILYATYNDCIFPNIDTVKVNSILATPSVSVPLNPQICSGISLTLSPIVTGGTPPYSYAWNTNIATSNTYTTPLLYAPMNYTFTVSDSRNCRKTATIDININPIPKVKSGDNDTLTCTKLSITLTGSIIENNNPTTTLQWQRKTQIGTVILGNTLSISPIKEAGTYVFIAQSAAGCSSRDSLTIGVDTIHPLFILGRGDSTQCTYSADGKITTLATGGRLPLQYKIDNEAFQDSSIFRNLTGGIHTVIVQGRNGCTDKKTIKVPQPLALTVAINTREKFDYIYAGNTIPMVSKVTNARGTVRYQWTATPSVNFDCKNCPNPKFKINAHTIAQLVVLDIYNCSAQDTLNFTLRNTTNPDIITPSDKDGKNDKLMFIALDDCLLAGNCAAKYPNSEMTIQNRWGNTVYHAKPYLNDWDGTNQNGQELPAGTYYYVLRLNLSQGHIIKGNVLIVR